jgi:hypothetical protein
MKDIIVENFSGDKLTKEVWVFRPKTGGDNIEIELREYHILKRHSVLGIFSLLNGYRLFNGLGDNRGKYSMDINAVTVDDSIQEEVKKELLKRVFIVKG